MGGGGFPPSGQCIPALVKRTLKCRSESNDSRFAIGLERFETVIVLWRKGLNDSVYQKPQLAMFLVRFLFIIYSLFESPRKWNHYS